MIWRNCEWINYSLIVWCCWTILWGLVTLTGAFWWRSWIMVLWVRLNLVRLFKLRETRVRTYFQLPRIINSSVLRNWNARVCEEFLRAFYICRWTTHILAFVNQCVWSPTWSLLLILTFSNRWVSYWSNNTTYRRHCSRYSHTKASFWGGSWKTV